MVELESTRTINKKKSKVIQFQFQFQQILTNISNYSIKKNIRAYLFFGTFYVGSNTST
jgi:hypothetical protein